jgi:hypothetical protein
MWIVPIFGCQPFPLTKDIRYERHRWNQRESTFDLNFCEDPSPAMPICDPRNCLLRRKYTIKSVHDGAPVQAPPLARF